MAVNMVAINVRMNFGDVKVGILGAFAAFDDERRGNELQRVAVSGKIFLDLLGEVRLRLREGFIKDQEDFFDLAGFIARQRLLQNEIGGIEDVVGKEHAQIVVDPDRFSYNGHGLKLEPVARDF